MDLKKEYNGKKILVTGGLGFIGSNLSQKLVKLGSDVTIMDSRIQHLGANDYNIRGIENNIKLHKKDLREKDAVFSLIKGKEIVFNFAAQVDYKMSNIKPILDRSINIDGHQNVLEAVREINPSCRIIFPGSRTQYGHVPKEALPVKEDYPLDSNNPLSIYSIHKTTMEHHHLLYAKNYGLETAVLRITNPFGPRAKMKDPSYCIVNWFIGQALQGNDLTIFGNGEQLRDYIYIDDLTDAILHAGVTKNLKSHAYNIGSGIGIPFIDMAKEIVRIVKGTHLKVVPYPENQKNFESGDFYADISRAKQELEWDGPKISLKQGLENTIQYYKKNLSNYLD